MVGNRQVAGFKIKAVKVIIQQSADVDDFVLYAGGEIIVQERLPIFHQRKPAG